MSRVGKKEIVVPEDIKVEIGDKVVVSKGDTSLETPIPSQISVKQEGNVIIVARKGEDKKSRSLHGLVRNLIFNMVSGMQTPFEKVLEIKGIGYKANVSGNELILNVGYSHPVHFSIPEGINIKVDPKANQVTISGVDKVKVGSVASEIRLVRPPEPYKGTGIMYLNERIQRKAGKAGAVGTGK